MKYGVSYGYSKWGETIRFSSTYHNFKRVPFEGNKAFAETPKSVSVLFLFDSAQERKDFDRKVCMPPFTYTLRLGKKRLEEIERLFNSRKILSTIRGN